MHLFNTISRVCICEIASNLCTSCDESLMQGSGAEEHHHHHNHHQQQQQQHHLSRALMAESGATIVTAAEAEASKKNIMDFLLHHSAYELLPESGKVCLALSSTHSVGVIPC
jgi:hypothetical protein